MVDTFTQTDRLLSVETPLGADKLILESFIGYEELSRLFEFELDMVSLEQAIDPNQIVGKAVTVRVEPKGGTARFFHGHVNRWSAGSSDERGFRRYRASVVPALWFLTKRSDCRIFQEKSIPDILKELLDPVGIEFDDSGISGTHTPHDYRVQYRESDFNFFSRLCEEEGIFYFFTHEDGKHVLKLADAASAYTDCEDDQPAYSPDPGKGSGIRRWEHRYEFITGKFALSDYNFTTPKKTLLGSTSTVESLPGAKDHEVFDYPGGHLDKGAGTDRAKLRMEEEEAAWELAEGDSDCSSFTPGGKFTLSEHTIADEAGGAFVLHSVRHAAVDKSSSSASDATQSYQNTFLCLPSAKVFRPALVTERPVVNGLESAVVTGPGGEEIHTDEHGRIKVQFHWDRQGKLDEKTSCWIRVAQSWAGKGWGALFLPRIGHEVVISFLNGDPDRPLVTGCVYNAENPPPYDLPADRTQSGIKSRSSLEGGTDDFNEIRFEDKKDSELVYIHAQKDREEVVENDHKLEVGHDQTIDVGNDQKMTIGNDRVEGVEHDRSLSVGNDKSESIANNKAISVGANHDEAVGGNMTIGIDKNRTMTIGDKLSEKVGGSMSLTVADDRELAVGKNETIEVSKDAKLTIGGQSTNAVKKEYTLKAKKIELTADDELSIKVGKAKLVMKKNGDVTLDGKKITVKGSGDVVIKGSKVAQN